MKDKIYEILSPIIAFIIVVFGIGIVSYLAGNNYEIIEKHKMIFVAGLAGTIVVSACVAYKTIIESKNKNVRRFLLTVYFILFPVIVGAMSSVVVLAISISAGLTNNSILNAIIVIIFYLVSSFLNVFIVYRIEKKGKGMGTDIKNEYKRDVKLSILYAGVALAVLFTINSELQINIPVQVFVGCLISLSIAQAVYETLDS